MWVAGEVPRARRAGLPRLASRPPLEVNGFVAEAAASVGVDAPPGFSPLKGPLRQYPFPGLRLCFFRQKLDMLQSEI